MANNNLSQGIGEAAKLGLLRGFWRLFAVQGILVDLDGAVGGFVFFDTLLGQVFQLGVEGAFVVLGDLGDFVEQLRLETDSGLNFVGRHDNTSLTL